MKKITLAYLQAPTKIGEYGGVTEISNKQISRANGEFYLFDNGGVLVNIGNISYVIAAANVKVCMLAEPFKPEASKK